MIQCRYAGQPSGPQYELWREEFGRKWLSVDFEPVEGDYLVSEFSSTEHSFLSLCAMRGSPLHAVRRNDGANRLQDHLYWIVASASRVRTRQRGLSNELGVGQMALMSAGEPARVTQTMQGSRWSIRIPRCLMKEVCRNFDDRIARPVSASHHLTNLLLHQIDTAHRFGLKLDPCANHIMAQHILDLVVLCLGGDKDAAHLAEQRGLAAARLDAIKSDILRELGSSELQLQRLAARHHVSTRYVQHLFERTGTSFTGFVLEQRLSLAYRLLRDPSNFWRKISDIARTAGFSDLSYFNRSFKSRFGATPRDIRAAMVVALRADGTPAAGDDMAMATTIRPRSLD